MLGLQAVRKAQELLSALRQIRGKKVITLSLQTDDNESDHVFDIDEKGKVGYLRQHKHELLSLLDYGIRNGGGMIVRHFSKLSYQVEGPEGSSLQVPYKQVFAVLLGGGDYHPLSKAETEEVCCHDAVTGRRLPRERGVIYKGFPAIEPATFSREV